MKNESGTHMIFPIVIYETNSDVVAPFLDTNREKFSETQNFIENEQAHLESVRKYRGDLKTRIAIAKNEISLQLNSVFDTLDQKALKVEEKILANIAEFKATKKN